MLDKEQLLRLNRSQKYREIQNIFLDEYKNILITFFEKSNIRIVPNPNLAHLISTLQIVENGKYSTIADYLSELLFSDTISLSDSITSLVDMYNTISSTLLG